MDKSTAIAWLHYLLIQYAHKSEIQEALNMAIDKLKEIE